MRRWIEKASWAAIVVMFLIGSMDLLAAFAAAVYQATDGPHDFTFTWWTFRVSMASFSLAVFFWALRK